MSDLTSVIYKDNSSFFIAAGIVDPITRAEQGDATVTLESLKDEETAAPVTGVSLPAALVWTTDKTWSIDMVDNLTGETWQLDITGYYLLTVAPGLSVTPGRWYLAVFKAVSTAGRIGQWTERVRCKTRQA